MLEVHKDNFNEEVLSGSGLVVVDFWGPKCEKCLAIMPDMEVLAAKYSGQAKFCKLDVTGNRRLAIAEKVLGLPTVSFYKDGKKVAELTKDDVELAAIEAKIQELL
ncbi:MAG: thioredoxin [Syntrophomonadaceae bacterium]|jgi:thioredoxin 1|nr:thioredoxin [Syntrophomonadaceae bacterium]